MFKRGIASRKVLSAVAGLVLVLAAFVGYFVPSAAALPPNEVWREYYSDASYTNLVGERVLFCNGQRWQWGVVTSYVITWTEPCF